MNGEIAVKAVISAPPKKEKAAEKVEDILLQGTPGYFYMDRSVLSELDGIDGIEKMTAFTLTSNGRRREFAVLRVIGFSRKRLSRLILTEALILCAAGGFAGILLTAAAVLPFGSLMEQQMGLPMLMPGAGRILLLGAAAFVTVMLTGPASAAYSAYTLSRADTAKILREVN